ncbi:MAG: hypothetical protein JXO51_02385 [Candidatus Aminicenantes bacterium]|nr:hypothetical protein [Candidatus Aminicenantes bacterium]
MKPTLVLLLALGASLAFCGKKGPLVLEPAKSPLAVVDLQLCQVGHDIEVTWKYPALLSDKKTPLQSAQVRGVLIHHLSKPFPPDSFAKKSKVVAKPRSAELVARPDGTFSFALPFKTKQLQGKEHAMAVAYQYGRTRSALSAVARITTRTPPEAVRDLKAGREGKVVVLTWTRPAADSEGRPLPSLLGYRVYRRILAAGAPPPFMPLRAAPVRGEYCEDHDTGADGEYEYRVSSLLAANVESAPSNTAALGIVDTFPPDTPANLVSFLAKDHVFLTWEAVRDRDLDHYVVYRKTQREEDFQVLDAAVGDNFYRDRRVSRGQVYIYAVTAVDKKGNESELGRPARQAFE